MNPHATIAAAALGCLMALADAPALAGERMSVEFEKAATDAESGLEYRYEFKVRTLKAKTPVEGAEFMIATDMPAMPGAHHMPHVKAEPGEAAGSYHATIDFDMAGAWNLILRFSKPRRDQIVLSDKVEKMPGGKEGTHKHH